MALEAAGSIPVTHPNAALAFTEGQHAQVQLLLLLDPGVEHDLAVGLAGLPGGPANLRPPPNDVARPLAQVRRLVGSLLWPMDPNPGDFGR